MPVDYEPICYTCRTHIKVTIKLRNIHTSVSVIRDVHDRKTKRIYQLNKLYLRQAPHTKLKESSIVTLQRANRLSYIASHYKRLVEAVTVCVNVVLFHFKFLGRHIRERLTSGLIVQEPADVKNRDHLNGLTAVN